MNVNPMNLAPLHESFDPPNGLGCGSPWPLSNVEPRSKVAEGCRSPRRYRAFRSIVSTCVPSITILLLVAMFTVSRAAEITVPRERISLI